MQPLYASDTRISYTTHLMVFDGEENESLRVFTKERLIFVGKLVVVLDRLDWLCGLIKSWNALDWDSDLVCVIERLNILLVCHHVHLHLFHG